MSLLGLQLCLKGGQYRAAYSSVWGTPKWVFSNHFNWLINWLQPILTGTIGSEIASRWILPFKALNYLVWEQSNRQCPISVRMPLVHRYQILGEKQVERHDGWVYPSKGWRHLARWQDIHDRTMHENGGERKSLFQIGNMSDDQNSGGQKTSLTGEMGKIYLSWQAEGPYEDSWKWD